MAALNKNHLNDSIGYLYIAPFDTSATLTAPDATGSNAAEVMTSFESAYPESKWVRLASIKGLSLEEDPSTDKKEVITDDTGLIFTSAKAGATVKATWYESKNPDAKKILTGISAVNVVTGSSPNEQTDAVTAYAISNRSLPRFAVKIEGIRGNRKEKYYISDATISGQIVTQFLKAEGEPEGSSIEMKASEGGFVIKSLPVIA